MLVIQVQNTCLSWAKSLKRCLLKHIIAFKFHQCLSTLGPDFRVTHGTHSAVISDIFTFVQISIIHNNFTRLISCHYHSYRKQAVIHSVSPTNDKWNSDANNFFLWYLFYLPKASRCRDPQSTILTCSTFSLKHCLRSW